MKRIDFFKSILGASAIAITIGKINTEDGKIKIPDIKIGNDIYTAKKITIGREISDKDTKHFITKDGRHPTCEELFERCKGEEKEWITESILKGIRENNLIDFDITDRSIAGKLYVYIKA